MKDAILAKRYAKALLDSLGEGAPLDEVSLILEELSQTIEDSADLQGIFFNPATHPEIKKKILESLAKRLSASDSVVRFLEVLLQKGRISLLSSVSVQFEEMVFEKMNRLRLRVKTAQKMSDSQVDKLKTKFKEKTSKEIFLDLEEDPSLLGGIVVQMGDIIFDGSVKNQLKTIKGLLEQEAGI